MGLFGIWNKKANISGGTKTVAKSKVKVFNVIYPKFDLSLEEDGPHYVMGVYPGDVIDLDPSNPVENAAPYKLLFGPSARSFVEYAKENFAYLQDDDGDADIWFSDIEYHASGAYLDDNKDHKIVRTEPKLRIEITEKGTHTIALEIYRNGYQYMETPCYYTGDHVRLYNMAISIIEDCANASIETFTNGEFTYLEQSDLPQ